MEIENILNDIFDLSITIDGSGNFDRLISLLKKLSLLLESIRDENFRQWVSEYTGFWMNPQNLLNDIDGFRNETSDLLVGFGDQEAMDLEM